MGLRALTAGVLLLAVALGVAQHRGLIPQDRLHQLQGGLLQQPAVAAAVAYLRSLPWLEGLLPGLPAHAGCACGVSVNGAMGLCGAGMRCWRAARGMQAVAGPPTPACNNCMAHVHCNTCAPQPPTLLTSGVSGPLRRT